MTLRIGYFASLREACGLEEETVEISSSSLSDLYATCAGIHGFRLAKPHLRVAVNHTFVDWNHPLKDGDFVVFIPPVAGG